MIAGQADRAAEERIQDGVDSDRNAIQDRSRLHPSAFRFVARCSIRLSYQRMRGVLSLWLDRASNFFSPREHKTVQGNPAVCTMARLAARFAPDNLRADNLKTTKRRHHVRNSGQ